MQIYEALKELTEQLSIACGGEVTREQTRLGHSIINSQITFISGGSEVRIRDAGMPDSRIEGAIVPYESVVGGQISIKFAGEAQPEAARVYDSILKNIVDELGIKTGTRRFATPDAGNTGREIHFSVPDDKAAAFALKIHETAKRLRQSSQLQNECRRAINFSLSHINKISPGIKSFIDLVMPVQHEGSEKSFHPYFRLCIEGMPEDLVAILNETVYGQQVNWRDSPARHTRDGSEKVTGGKTIFIPMGISHTDAAFADIERYLVNRRRLEQLHPDKRQEGPKELPGP